MSEYVLAETKHGLTIKTTLYGDITPERLERARQDLRYRLEQLVPDTKSTPVRGYSASRDQYSSPRSDSYDFSDVFTDDDEDGDDEKYWDDFDE